MSNQVFAAPQQWIDFWKKATEDNMTRFQAATEEWARLEGQGVEQAATMVDEVSRLTRESFAYAGQLAAEWRKLTMEAMKKAG